MLQLRLGNLIEKLDKCKPYKPLYFENVQTDGKGYAEITLVEIDVYLIDPHRSGVGSLGSWRGDYSEFALPPEKEVGTVSDALKDLDAGLGKTFEGYKGGDFVAHANVPMWCAEWGESSVWTRTDRVYDFPEGTREPLLVNLALVDVLERDDEVVILYKEKDTP